MREQIGTVTIKRLRVYPLDPNVDPDPFQATVLVEPGVYPVFRDGISTYWRLTGVLNHRAYSMGDGMMRFSEGGDLPSDDDVVFYSKQFGPDDWSSYLNETIRDAHSPLEFDVTEPVDS